jgi:hypothetical protein
MGWHTSFVLFRVRVPGISYLNSKRRALIWDEMKRLINLEKHHLDFADASLVIQKMFRIEKQQTNIEDQ